jgi:hypothetical protein
MALKDRTIFQTTIDDSAQFSVRSVRHAPGSLDARAAEVQAIVAAFTGIVLIKTNQRKDTRIQILSVSHNNTKQCNNTTLERRGNIWLSTKFRHLKGNISRPREKSARMLSQAMLIRNSILFETYRS